MDRPRLHAEVLMPLVRIDFMHKDRPSDFGRRAGEVIYEEMVVTLNVPRDDKFFVAMPHSPDELVYDPRYLGIARGDGILYIQITLNEGRTVEQKKTFYKSLAQRLNRDLGVRLQDVFINLVEVKKENWSFGNGEAQYA
jgi:phenylpyruvate tautomerase PptA (4-oxalocrotonate tautomerase family)